jgi:hypothetical protein
MFEAGRGARSREHAVAGSVRGSRQLEATCADGARYGDRVRETAVSHDDVAAHLNAMDVLCAPSLTTDAWREQFGRMLIEALPAACR